MPNFSRRTLLAALDTFETLSHSQIDRYLLQYGLESVAPVAVGNKQKRATAVASYLLGQPEREDEDGENLIDTIVEERVRTAITVCTHYDGFHYAEFQTNYPALHRGLERDGFTVEDGQLRRALPQALDLPEADDEVHALLDAYHFTTPKGHLDQAIAAHSRGDWAAANAQFRPFIESLLDEIAERLNGGAAGLPAAGNPRRQWLAQTNPPFFIGALNEWTGQGTGFLEGFYRRLHPQGAHPGLSDEDDSTFRLHLVLLVARLLLKRLQQLRPV
jgi:hypothetical protein